MKVDLLAVILFSFGISSFGYSQSSGVKAFSLLHANPPRLFNGDDPALKKIFLDKVLDLPSQMLNLEEMESVRREVDQPLRSQELIIARGGGSSNGGGGGVRFKTAEGYIFVVTNDYWETPVLGPLEPALPNESALGYLHRVLDLKIKPLDSYFYNRLIEAVGEVLIAPWNPRANLPLIPDLGNLQNPLPAGHEAVQIAIRYSLSKPGYRPQIFIDYDPELLVQLNTENLALLILHEAIYMWGTELRHQDSAKVRALAVRLLSYRGFPKIRVGKLELSQDQTPSVFFQMEIRKLGFANFVELFEKETQAHSSTDLSARRRLVYSAFIRKMHGANGGVQAFNDEEAFFYLYLMSQPYFDGQLKRIEDYIQSSQPETKVIHSICKLGRALPSGQVSIFLQIAMQPYLNRALRYCDSF